MFAFIGAKCCSEQLLTGIESWWDKWQPVRFHFCLCLGLRPCERSTGRPVLGTTVFVFHKRDVIYLRNHSACCCRRCCILNFLAFFFAFVFGVLPVCERALLFFLVPPFTCLLKALLRSCHSHLGYPCHTTYVLYVPIYPSSFMWWQKKKNMYRERVRWEVNTVSDICPGSRAYSVRSCKFSIGGKRNVSDCSRFMNKQICNET